MVASEGSRSGRQEDQGGFFFSGVWRCGSCGWDGPDAVGALFYVVLMFFWIFEIFCRKKFDTNRESRLDVITLNERTVLTVEFFTFLRFRMGCDWRKPALAGCLTMFLWKDPGWEKAERFWRKIKSSSNKSVDTVMVLKLNGVILDDTFGVEYFAFEHTRDELGIGITLRE